MAQVAISYNQIINQYNKVVFLHKAGKYLQLNALYKQGEFTNIVAVCDRYGHLHIGELMRSRWDIGTALIRVSPENFRRYFILRAITDYRLYNGQWFRYKDNGPIWGHQFASSMMLDVIREELRRDPQFLHNVFLEYSKEHGFSKTRQKAFWRAIKQGKILHRQNAGWSL